MTEVDAQLLGRDTDQHLARAWREQKGLPGTSAGSAAGRATAAATCGHQEPEPRRPR